MVAFRNIAIVLVFSVVFALMTCVVTAGLHLVAPSYVGGFFPLITGNFVREFGFDAAILQGLLHGLFIGVIVVLVLALFHQLQIASSAEAFTKCLLFGGGFMLGVAVVGYAVGTLRPRWFSDVLVVGRRADYQPEEFGIGLGCSQGLIFGVVIGAFVVAVSAWKRSRSAIQRETEGDKNERAHLP